MNVTVALGGGGVKCYSQIGVMKVLEQEGLQVQGIAGTSAGGIVAALYAAGYSPEEIQAFHERLDLRQLLRRKCGEGPGLFGLTKAKEAFQELLEDRTFADLRVPLALTSVDLNTGQAHMLTEGRVLDALMIAVAIPGLFPPTPRGDQVLLDGGILNPVPVSAARSLASEYPVIAVALFPPHNQWHRHPFPNLLRTTPIIRHIIRLPWIEAFNIYVRAMDISQRMLADLRLEIEKPELIIRPEVHHLGLLDELCVSEIVALGKKATQKALEHWNVPLPEATNLLNYSSSLNFSIPSRN